MYYLILVILLIILILLAYLLTKLVEFNKKQDEIKLELSNENYKIYNDLSVNVGKISESQKNSENMLTTFKDISIKLKEIESTQKNIDKLSLNILDFQKILTDKKTRGIFGESQLNQILYKIFGEKGLLYDLQYTLGDNKKVDAVVFAPEPLGIIPIDSKFPLENYNKIENGENAKGAFIKDIKKHIDDINSKYVNSTSATQAIMFIPAESIYVYIIKECYDLINYAYERNVLIAAPMSLMSVLTIMQMLIITQKRNEISEQLHNELLNLEPEFVRYKKRWDDFIKTVQKLEKDANDINITTKKIGDKFESIKNAK